MLLKILSPKVCKVWSSEFDFVFGWPNQVLYAIRLWVVDGIVAYFLVQRAEVMPFYVNLEQWFT